MKKNLKHKQERRILYLLGNPNVGKSTVFNALTGLKQHTGNWAGKTVDACFGRYSFGGAEYDVIDLPGTHSVGSCFDEECVTTSNIDNECSHVHTYSNSTTVIFVDATALRRGLPLTLEYLERPKAAQSNSVILCVNLCDIAKKRGIEIDTEKLSSLLGIPVVPISARSKAGILKLKQTIAMAAGASASVEQPCDDTSVFPKSSSEAIGREAAKICAECVSFSYDRLKSPGHKFDKIITSRLLGIPLMLVIFGAILWITIYGANYPSELLAQLFGSIDPYLDRFLGYINAPEFLKGILLDGVYKTVTWIVAVMLPPMAIFFPMFTILEDLGLLPRIAFNLDRCYARTNMSGKQCLTQCMGLGCNAVGVSGSKIMPSENQRTISIITNSFMPCNGRFALLIAIASIFVGGAISAEHSGIIAVITVLALIILSFFITWIVSYILSITIYKDNDDIFSLELPEYRRPEIVKTLTVSLIHRTFAIVGRALLVSAPMGALIWLLGNIQIGDVTCLTAISEALDPIGKFFGVDGYILIAFILALPANEITLPVLLMAYLSTGSMSDISDISALTDIFRANSWTLMTAVNMMILIMYHSPCITTLLTIWRETHSIKKVALSILVPCTTGALLCLISKLIFSIVL